MNAEREIDLPIYYENEKVGSRRADFFVEGQVLVGLKAVDSLTATTQRPRSIRDSGRADAQFRHPPSGNQTATETPEPAKRTTASHLNIYRYFRPIANQKP
ncbi:GxxExxY protein [Hymenobacter artigasi]|uniref:GxxExxY protein n=1 Tax=Hymenobacter artigasi TaxID=2719616 RepID=UPI00361C706F